jgi:sulfur relay (sulfurtransferase) DsrC/TusE family protein
MPGQLKNAKIVQILDRETKEFYVKDPDKWDEEISEYIAKLEAAGYRIVACEPIDMYYVKVIGRRFECLKQNGGGG